MAKIKEIDWDLGKFDKENHGCKSEDIVLPNYDELMSSLTMVMYQIRKI